MARLTFLGTSGSVVTSKRMCSGILYKDKLIDVGFGVLVNLMRSRKNLDSINEVYISHTHSDHIGDFTGLVWEMAMENRTRPLRVISSAKAETVIRTILELQSTPPPWVKFEIVYLRPEDVKVEHLVTIHDPENFAYRFSTNKGDLVYVGDTAKYDRVAEFGKGCDTMIHEATFLGGQEDLAALTKHSTAKDAAATASIAKVKKLVLTHIAPSNATSVKRYLSEARGVFDGRTIVAQDMHDLAV
jgi:ribonuclease BN (tRNA processing enzyme)